jgi:hypothetical protein
MVKGIRNLFWRRKILGTIIIIVLGVTPLIFFGCYLYSEFWPTADKLKKQREDLEKIEKKIRLAEAEKTKYECKLAKFDRMLKKFYPENSKMRADLFIQREIESAAKSSGVILKSVSNARKRSIHDGINVQDVNITAEGSFPQQLAFLREIGRKPVCFYWKSCYISPRRRAKSSDLSLRGALGIVSYDPKEIEMIGQVKQVKK